MSALLSVLVLWAAAPPSADAQRDPRALLDAVEAKLLQAPRVRVTVEAKASRGIEADVRVELTLASKNRARLDASGRLLGGPAFIAMISDGREVHWAGFGMRAPTIFGRAMVVGFVRLGLLFNVMQMASGSPPDGMLAETPEALDHWAQLADVSFGTSREIDGVRTEAVRFSILLGGQALGEGTLWIDPVRSLPLLREHRVRFEGREVVVVERYVWDFAPKITARTFDLATRGR